MILLYVFAVVVLINCCYYFLFSKFSFHTDTEIAKEPSFPVSVIVCAKNEAANISENIPHILSQDYPDFEVILVNDRSTDKTFEVMEQFAENDPRVKLVNVAENEAFWGNKKYALTLGIKKAVNQRLLFTDADCKPNSNSWIREMTQQLTGEKQLVLGYGAYEKRPGVLNALIRFETVMTAIQYFAYQKAGMPYMGVGRNLAYTSPLFYDTKGFMSHIKLQSGDDDLFVNEAATRTNTAYCYAEKGFTISKPKTTFRSWMHQKRRHVTTANRYKPTHKLLLGLSYVTNLLFWVLLPFCLLFTAWQAVLLLVSIRIACQYIVIGKGARKLNENNLLPWLPFLEMFLVWLHLSIFIFNSKAKPTQWK